MNFKFVFQYRSNHHKLSLQLGLPDRPSSDNMAKRWVSGDRMQAVRPSLHMDAELYDDDKLMKGVDIDHVTSKENRFKII